MSDRTVRVKWSARDGGADRRRPAPRRRSLETHRTSPKTVFPGLFRLVFGSGSECVRQRAHSGALGGVWGLWRGTQQLRAALRGRGFAGVRLLAGQRGNKGKKKGMGTCFTSAQRAGNVQRGKAAVQRSCGGVTAAPSSVRRRSAGNGLLGVLLVV